MPEEPKTETLEKPVETAPATPPPAEKKPAPTPEELEASRSVFMAKMGFEPAEPKKVAEAPKEAPKEPESEPEEPEAEPVKEPEKVAEPAPEELPIAATAEVKPIQFDDEAASRIAEHAATKALEAARKPVQEPSVPKAPTSGMSARQQRVLATLKEMQENDPEYQGVPLVRQATDFFNREAAYVANWQREHPGEAFRREEEEHTEFYTANMPNYTDDAYEEAQARLVENRIKQAMEPVQKELQAIKHESRTQKMMPDIQARVMHDLGSLAAQSDPEVEKLVVKDGRPVLTKEVVEKMKEMDPITHHVLSAESTRLQAVVTEVEAMYAFPEQFQFDPDKAVLLPGGETVYPHREAERFMDELEKDLESRGPTKTMRDGKRFMRQNDYNAAAKEIIASSKTQDEARRRLRAELDTKAWTVDPRFFAQVYTQHLAERVKGRVKELKSLAGHNGATPKGTQSAKSTEGGQAKPAAKKPSPPSLPQASDKVKTPDNGIGNAQDRDAAIEARMWGF